jgi:thymidylate kinase
MLIILEGCDGVGKTTIARHLAERIDGDVRIGHCGPPEAHPLEETVLPLNGYRPGVGEHVVMDRFHIGELIYGPIYRNASLLGGIDGPGHRWVDAWLRSVGGLLVHVDAELTTVMERIDIRGDDYVKVEHLDRILTEYRQAFAASRGAPRIHVTSPPVEDHDRVDYILSAARQVEAGAAAGVLRDIPHVGAFNPTVLLVGDEPSPRHRRGDRPTYRAPFVPYRDSCGWFLYGALPAHLLIKTAVVNQCDLTPGNVHVLQEVPKLVAMGREAEKKLKRLGVELYGVVPHPQHVRRFHHARQVEYGNLIDVAGAVGEDLSHYFKKDVA